MSDFQPGALALVVGASVCTGNIGRQVTLEKFVPPHADVFYCDGYWCADEYPLWVVGADSLERNTEGGVIISDIAAHRQQDPRIIKPAPPILEGHSHDHLRHTV